MTHVDKSGAFRPPDDRPGCGLRHQRPRARRHLLWHRCGGRAACRRHQARRRKFIVLLPKTVPVEADAGGFGLMTVVKTATMSKAGQRSGRSGDGSSPPTRRSFGSKRRERRVPLKGKPRTAAAASPQGATANAAAPFGPGSGPGSGPEVRACVESKVSIRGRSKGASCRCGLDAAAGGRGGHRRTRSPPGAPYWCGQDRHRGAA